MERQFRTKEQIQVAELPMCNLQSPKLDQRET